MPDDLPNADAPTDDRSELITFVQALRAAVEWQSATGGTGLPRDPEAKKRVSQETAVDAGPRAAVAPGPTGTLAAGRPGELRQSAPAPQRAAAPREPAATLPLGSGEAGGGGQLDAQAAPQTAALGAALPVLRVAAGDSLEALAEHVQACRTCTLCERRTQTVFSRGTGKSGLCFVGEGPGAEEDAQGAPFVGAAGQLLDRMIAAMGIERDDVYVANIVKCRPPDNRKPTPDEMAACVPYLHRQIELLNPSVIVALGATALEGLLGKTGGITRHRGRFSLYRGKIAVMPTFHPAYLLRQPSAKREVWSDLQEVLRHMGRPVKEPRP
jgi:uracil-DNA glycosylase family 4